MPEPKLLMLQEPLSSYVARDPGVRVHVIYFSVNLLQDMEIVIITNNKMNTAT